MLWILAWKLRFKANSVFLSSWFNSGKIKIYKGIPNHLNINYSTALSCSQSTGLRQLIVEKQKMSLPKQHHFSSSHIWSCSPFFFFFSSKKTTSFLPQQFTPTVCKQISDVCVMVRNSTRMITQDWEKKGKVSLAVQFQGKMVKMAGQWCGGKKPSSCRASHEFHCVH